jgi:hypothetical protein
MTELSLLPQPRSSWVPQLVCDLVHDHGCWRRSARCDLVGHAESPSTRLDRICRCERLVVGLGSGGVFVRKSTRRNRDGSKVSYLQLAHNAWDPAAKTARTKLLYSFGRADRLDRAAIERLVPALTRGRGRSSRPPAARIGRVWSGRRGWSSCSRAR